MILNAFITKLLSETFCSKALSIIYQGKKWSPVNSISRYSIRVWIAILLLVYPVTLFAGAEKQQFLIKNLI